MVSLYKNPAVANEAIAPSPDGTGYTTYQEPDTRVPPKPKSVVTDVIVDGVKIPEDAILHEAQNHPAENPGAAVRSAAEALVVRQLLVNEASRRELTGDAPTSAKQSAENPQDRAIRLLLEQALKVPDASREECERYYQNNLERFRSPALYEARHILIAAPEDDQAAREVAYAKAEQICRDLANKPRQFGDFAKIHSDCSSARHGGSLGQLSSGSTVAEFEQALITMQEGEIGRAPVASRYGYHIIALDHIIESRQVPFELVAEKIRDWLEACSWTRASAQFIKLLAGQAKIEGFQLEGTDSPLVQ